MKSMRKRRQKRNFLLFILPAMVLYTALWMLPLVFNLAVSFTNWNGINPLSMAKIVGIRNYKNIFHDKIFYKAILHNLEFTGLNVLFIPAVSFLTAVAIEKSFIRKKGFLRTALFVPAILPMLLVSILFRWVYSVDGGMINSILEVFHLDSWKRNFLGDYKIALLCLFVINLWKNYPFYMTIFLSGLQGVPRELEEAARIDGAGYWKNLWYVTIPCIRPIVTVVVGLVIIDGFRVFDLVFNTTKGGPAYATEVMGTLIYRVAFSDSRLGYATALSTINVALVLVISFFYYRWNNSSEER